MSKIDLSAFTNGKKKKRKAKGGREYSVEVTGGVPAERTVIVTGAGK